MTREGIAPPAILAALGMALMLPMILAPTPLSDSHGINLVWSRQFTDLIAAGDPWPRWLPRSHDGLGAPVFYFYGPLAFWLAAGFGLAGLATWPAIAAAATVFSIGSGVSMWALLRTQGAPRALAGGAFYMAAPYHLLDFARRGAFAEHAAVALLPLVGLAIPRAATGRPAGLALAYAALILAHLPMALLASLFLVPMLVGLGRREPNQIVRIGGALAIGIGIAAAYLVPALALQSGTAMATMRAAPLQQPGNWTPATYWTGGVPAHLFLLAIGGAAACAAVAMMRHGRTVWGWHVLAVTALALGCAGPVWLLPGLDRVQFPWRALAVAEFGIAMLVGTNRLPGPKLLAAIGPLLVLSILTLAPTLAAISAPEPVHRLNALLHHYPDVPEYMPRRLVSEDTALLVRADRIARTTPSSMTRDGVTTIRRFAFPIWQAACPEGLRQTGISSQGLVRLPANCTLVRVATLAERIGRMISLASMAMLALLALARRRSASLLMPAGLPA